MKYILITGVSSGIGHATVRFLIDKGYYIFGSVRKVGDKAKLESDFPRNFTCLRFDVTKKEEVLDTFNQVKTILNGNHLSGLVNNAGGSVGGPMNLLSDEKFRQQIEVNLFGVRNVTNVFLPLLGAYKGFKGQPGKVINNSSLAGVFNTPFNGAYCVSKHAVESLGEIYRRELMLYGIDVVSIQSGPIESQIWTKNIGIFDEFADSDYANMLKKAETIMENAQKDALPAMVISKLIYKILNSRNPKTSYIVNKNKLLTTILVKYLPSRLVDRLLWKKLS
jgi:NAD(P)-dependent dehydrogenase (short-subunit alcohol dehydrogenase family)